MEFRLRINEKIAFVLLVALAMISSIGITMADPPNPGHAWSDIECSDCIDAGDIGSIGACSNICTDADTNTWRPVTVLVNTNTGRNQACSGSMRIMIDSNTYQNPRECLYDAACSIGGWSYSGADVDAFKCWADIDYVIEHENSGAYGDAGVYATYSWVYSGSTAWNCDIYYNAVRIC